MLPHTPRVVRLGLKDRPHILKERAQKHGALARTQRVAAHMQRLITPTRKVGELLLTEMLDTPKVDGAGQMVFLRMQKVRVQLLLVEPPIQKAEQLMLLLLYQTKPMLSNNEF